MRKVNKIKLFVNDNEKSRIVAADLELELKKYDFKIIDKGKYDLAISVGGDGSFLRMVKETNFNPDIYYIGVNSGTLGFLQEIDIKKCLDFVKRLNVDDYREEKISIQETKVVSEKEVYTFKALNEFTVRGEDYNAIKMDVKVDGELLENFIGDGLLISTSTGSTAYNMSFGGSIIYNTLNTLSIVPIAPLNNRVYSSLLVPVILPADKPITLIPNQENKNLSFKIDGVTKNINEVIKIDTKIGEHYIKCLRLNDFHFVKVINNKILGK